MVATELGKSLAKQGHEVHFITNSRPIRLDLFSENIYYHEVSAPTYPLFDSPPYESALASRMVDVAVHHQLDLFHVHYALPHASVAYLAKQILASSGVQIPFVLTLHGTDITVVGRDKSYEPVVSFGINQADAVTAVSQSLQKDTYTHFHVDREVLVIPNFVDTERFSRQAKEHFRKMLTPKGEKIIVHTSNFRKVKRIEDVVRTFALVQQHIPAKLIMVGDGPQRMMAEEMSRELNLTDKVVFLGAQDPVEEIYSIADLFLLLSESESFGLAALEAMACGVPVIASNSGGLPEVVEDGVSGFCCEIGQVECMAEKAVSLLTDKDKWATFSENARRRAEIFSLPHIIPQYEAIYRQVLDKIVKPVCI